MVAPVEHPLLQHPDPWTLEKWLELPERPRIELVDGLLVVSPVPSPRHQRLVPRLWQQLDAAAPPGFEVMIEVNIGLGGDRALIPDLSVVDPPGLEDAVIPARHVVLVVEVASPSTRVYDRTIKRQLYAEAGIACYLVVDPHDPPSAVCYELDGGDYVEAVRSTDGRLRLERPFPVPVDLTPATPPPAR